MDRRGEEDWKSEEQQQQQSREELQEANKQQAAGEENYLLAVGSVANTAKGKSPEEVASDNSNSPSQLQVTKKASQHQHQNQHQLLARAKFGHRSISSPSSLTTHKFGLRPTPSPPRLVLDQQTGDIIESYPEQPVYLRTYQPLEEEQLAASEEEDERRYREREAEQQQLTRYYNQLLLQESKRNPHSDYITSEQLLAMNSSNNKRSNSPNPSYRPAIPPPHSGRVYFAPPELSSGLRSANFAAGNSSSSALPNSAEFSQNLNHHHHDPATSMLPAHTNQYQESHNQDIRQPHQLTGAHNNSFRRALNKVNNNNNNISTNADHSGGNSGVHEHSPSTDIAFLTSSRSASPSAHSTATPARVKVTATSAARGNALLAKGARRSHEMSVSQHKAVAPLHGQVKTETGQRQVVAPLLGPANEKQIQQVPVVRPVIEDFSLYDFCYQFRLLLVCFISSFIIYLLLFPLHTDCATHRPTYTHVSLILASVNLFCVLIFSLFWYCNGVTRTLYANLSSSAFIVSIYSILVALNLALAILFFFINTCHFQKLITMPQPSEPSVGSFSRATHQLTRRSQPNLSASTTTTAAAGRSEFGKEENSSLRENVEKRLSLHLRNLLESLERTEGASQVRWSRQVEPADGDGAGGDTTRQPESYKSGEEDDADGDDDELDGDDDDDDAQTNTVEGENEGDWTGEKPQMSPLEAAWEFLCERFRALRRLFRHFLLTYDLRFIGALHALCAICFQYMAMKVAVVRSYFCSPVSGYC